LRTGLDFQLFSTLQEPRHKKTNEFKENENVDALPLSPKIYILKMRNEKYTSYSKRFWKSDVVSKRSETYPTLVYALADMHYAILNTNFLYHMCGPMGATMNSHPHIYGVHATTLKLKTLKF